MTIVDNINVFSSGGPQGPQGGPGTLPVNAVATANVGTLSGFAQTVDGVLLNTDGWTVLLTAQSNPVQNGLWVIHNGAWTRPSYWGSGSSQLGTLVSVLPGGTIFGQSLWEQLNLVPVVIDTGSPTFGPVPWDSGWQNFNLTNSWVSAGGMATPGYRRVGQLVRCRGMIGGGAAATIATALSPVYRIAQNDEYIADFGSAVFNRIQVRSDGTIQVQSGTSWSFVSLAQLAWFVN